MGGGVQWDVIRQRQAIRQSDIETDRDKAREKQTKNENREMRRRVKEERRGQMVYRYIYIS